LRIAAHRERYNDRFHACLRGDPFARPGRLIGGPDDHFRRVGGQPLFHGGQTGETGFDAGLGFEHGDFP